MPLSVVSSCRGGGVLALRLVRVLQAFTQKASVNARRAG